MSSKQFSFIELFAGIGGFRIALTAAGGTCVFASEWDKFCQKTYAENFKEMPIGDITQVAVTDIPDHDILTAGFPCQPFSIAGVSKHNALGTQHGFNHPTQGTLFFDIVRILAHKRPAAFLLENVKNLVSHDKGKTFELMTWVLERELGYHIHYQVLDAGKLLPQHRERIFIVGFRDPIQFNFPELPDKKPKIKAILEPNVTEKYTLTDHLWQYLQNYALKHQQKGNGFGYGLVDLEGVSRTLSARYYKDGSEILIPQPPQNPRRLTPRECARLQGFPDSFIIPVSDTRAYKQFGNSVAVPVVQAVAESIVQTLQTATLTRYTHKSFQQARLF